MPDDEKPQEPKAKPTAIDEAQAAMDAASKPEAKEDAKEDAARPEAILKRVEALGEEDELERVAREEEAKLAERRKQQKKGKKKAGLEAAASKRLAQIGAKAPVKRSIAVAVDADPLIERATQLRDWAKKNQRSVAIVAAVAVLGAAGAGAYAYREKHRESAASAELAKAVADERGRIGDPSKDDSEERHDPRPVFKTVEDRRETALREYRDVEAKYGGTGAAILARLSEGSILLDKHDVDGAVAAFSDVKGSPLAAADAEVKGRALEGLGLAYELKASTLPKDQAGPAYDQALQTFRELENTDVTGFKELGMYHQARVVEAKGDKDKAIELLKSLHERLAKAPTEPTSHPFPYLQEVTDDRLRALDPSAVPPKPPPGLGGPGGASGMNEAQMRKLIEQLQRQAQQKGGGP